jgi:hypothetical protein
MAWVGDDGWWSVVGGRRWGEGWPRGRDDCIKERGGGETAPSDEA